MSNQELKKESPFQNAWFSRSNLKVPDLEKKLSPVQQSFEEIKQYAYSAFDKLDTNGNGFIEANELTAALNSDATDMREKSFITFLLTNQDAIADSCHEGGFTVKGGISRLDIESYFKLVLNMLEK